MDKISHDATNYKINAIEFRQIQKAHWFFFSFSNQKSKCWSCFEAQASAVILSIAAQSILLRQLLVSDRLSNQSISASPALVPVSSSNRYSSGPNRFLPSKVAFKIFTFPSSFILVCCPRPPLPRGVLGGDLLSIFCWYPKCLSSLWFAECSFVWLLESLSIPRLVTWDMRSFGRKVTDGKFNNVKYV